MKFSDVDPDGPGCRRAVSGWEDTTFDLRINEDFQTAGLKLHEGRLIVPVPALKVHFMPVSVSGAFNPSASILIGYSASEFDAALESGKPIFEIKKEEASQRVCDAIEAGKHKGYLDNQMSSRQPNVA